MVNPKELNENEKRTGKGTSKTTKTKLRRRLQKKARLKFIKKFLSAIFGIIVIICIINLLIAIKHLYSYSQNINNVTQTEENGTEKNEITKNSESVVENEEQGNINEAEIEEETQAEEVQQEEVLIAEAIITSESSSENRNYNIALACERLNGLTLYPGEQFDWYGNNGLGSANKENGFKESTIISGGKYVKGYGGGVCQVCTALYNCIYKLNIIPDEIHHHSKAATYVEAGMDATVAYGSKNFIFTNTKDYTIKFEFLADGGSVTVRAYELK